ncbi:hypothetical protein EJ05DRAFT_526534 [Pseudovirgaria hyperparasitica]|uniref:Ricin B lectin domain-containing protein n=1 Tax=Pseudovirgaria hyperparasitica TaxID=470096 RepID=A0A6A6WE50_9PEZI|nr:uncharacterized protein EJ05DRAFT_526534 [Pseudovirgaria hyperparasitica]KAF2759847.1 hypothetical protein EJ05DRAFT_526534 [Pseudovirgaria hyperparasitica]
MAFHTPEDSIFDQEDRVSPEPGSPATLEADQGYASAGPYSGGKFYIMHRDTGKCLTLTGGRLGLESCYSLQGHCLWECVEDRGRLGFRNTASHTYIGHDGIDGTMIATARQHGVFEWINVLPLEAGGFKIMSEYMSAYNPIAVRDDERSVGQTTGEPSGWDFIRVDPELL